MTEFRGNITGPKGQRQAIIRDQHGIVWFSPPVKTVPAAKKLAKVRYPSVIWSEPLRP